MPSAQRTIHIDRPPAEVFSFFTDPANDRRWRQHVREIAARGPIKVGATIHHVVKGPFGRGHPADIEVTGLEPGARYAFRVIDGPARPVGEFRFSPAGAGTEVSFSLSARLDGLRGMFLSRPVQRSMDGEMAALDRAKQIIEQG